MSEPETKRQKVEQAPEATEIKDQETVQTQTQTRTNGIAPIKKEFIIEIADSKVDPNEEYNDEDEGGGVQERSANGPGDKKKRGQNKNRNLTQAKETIMLCENIKNTANPADCKFGDSCRREHDITKYLESKPVDLEGMCPVFEAIGYCPAGLRCRWLGSHYSEGKLTGDVPPPPAERTNERNRVETKVQFDLQRKKFNFELSVPMMEYLEKETAQNKKIADGAAASAADSAADAAKDSSAAYIEPPFKPQEKRKLNYDRAKILSPLTTVGNLPFRRLMKTLGADVTFSEMALSLPLVQGNKSEWALARAHESEVGGFGIQIAGGKYWQTTKAAEAIAKLCPDVNELNLNCGCPIDLLYRQGAGSALMDSPSRLMKMLKGMNHVSGEIPVTVKIRTGTRDKHPTAVTLVKRLLDENQVGAITLHGRSRAQRYTKLADWEYIKQVADVVKEYDYKDGAQRPWVIGNGDVYSWQDWHDAVDKTGVDSVMVARGALIKPWIFEEIESRQYLDKSASERLEMIGKFAKYGLDHWGSDAYGINITRRFLCEWLSFTHRYIPEGILEMLPPKLNDRPPPFVGRSDLETLLASSDYKDWIKITEMFLGPVSEGFEFTPKHKSNAYST